MIESPSFQEKVVHHMAIVPEQLQTLLVQFEDQAKTLYIRGFTTPAVHEFYPSIRKMFSTLLWRGVVNICPAQPSVHDGELEPPDTTNSCDCLLGLLRKPCLLSQRLLCREHE